LRRSFFMEKVDYIIVGCGLAGATFASICEENQKSFIVFDATITNSSKIAGGIFNPLILKRFTYTYKAKELLELASAFYSNLELKFNQKILHYKSFHRRLFSIEEQNNWTVASDKPNVGQFMESAILQNNNNRLNAPFGFGNVLGCGYLDVNLFLDTIIGNWKEKACYQSEQFEYNSLKIHTDFVVYKNIKAKHIVFADGFAMLNNPFFSKLPLDGAKGELLLIKAPNLKLDFILKGNVFILPVGNDLYKVGATYNWTDKTNTITEEAKEELLLGLKEIINCDFEIVEQYAGVRPTVKDRKPLVGTHPKHQNLHILNGLGTRGVTWVPYLASQLFNHIENKEILDSEIDIKRLKGFPSSFFDNQ